MDVQDRLAWVTEFDNPVPGRERRSVGLIAFLATLFGGGSMTALALLVTALSHPAKEEAGIVGTAGPLPSPTPTVSASVEFGGDADGGVTSARSMLPSGCAGLYSEAMSITLTGLGFTLGSRWQGEQPSGSADEQLQSMMRGAALDCHWSRTHPDEAALLTTVVDLSEQQEVAVRLRLSELGYQRLAEHGGDRYIIERTGSDGSSGESHFLRDGLWFSTHWLGHGQYGYTADMVRSVYS